MLFGRRRRSFFEQQRYAPDSRKRYYGVYYAADNCRSSSECPGNKVKFKKTDKSPVKSADYNKDKTYLIKHTYLPDPPPVIK